MSRVNTPMQLTTETLKRAYVRMRTIREFEERLHAEVAMGAVPGFSHLSAGQEAVAVGVCMHLSDDDHSAGTHRGHGHCLAKGSDVNEVMAEIYGRADGLCSGKGGSMHLIDTQHGFLGANGIVGAGFPIAAGAALSHRIRGTGGVAVAFGGDGSSNQGSVFEALNLAVVFKLPVLFVFENNGFSQFTSAEFGTGSGDLLARAQAFGMPGIRVDGSDFFAIHEAAGDAIRRARGGGGPSVMEATLARFFGHYEGDPQSYRPRDEIAKARASQDCLVRFRERVTRDRLLVSTELDALDEQAMGAVDGAVEFARRSPLPTTSAELISGVYVSY
jgi:acetoin:2,6-dichlorophenolindophenol oxidoreductase subunit alpha